MNHSCHVNTLNILTYFNILKINILIRALKNARKHKRGSRNENGNWPLLRNPDKEVRNKYGNTRHTLYLDTLKIRKLPSFSGSTKYQGNHLLFRIFYLSRLTYLTYIKSAPGMSFGHITLFYKQWICQVHCFLLIKLVCEYS